MELRANGPDRPDLLFIGSRCAFLSLNIIKRIIDNILQINSEESLRPCVEGWKYWDDYGPALWQVGMSRRRRWVKQTNIDEQLNRFQCNKPSLQRLSLVLFQVPIARKHPS